jgi:hypothetical protein
LVIFDPPFREPPDALRPLDLDPAGRLERAALPPRDALRLPPRPLLPPRLLAMASSPSGFSTLP